MVEPGTQTGNGRVNLSHPSYANSLGDGRKSGSFPGFEFQQTVEQNFQADMLRGTWEQGALSDAFFSKPNVVAIQAGIRRYVYEKSQPKGYVIDDQSADELKIIMRAMYYQYARNSPTDIPGQVSELNQLVVNWSGPHILSAVDHYIHYLKDIDTLPIPMAHPVHLSSAGSRSLSMAQPFL